MIDNILNEFKLLGYCIQEPTTDKTYFFARQAEKGHKFIWVKLTKIPEIECTFNGQPGQLTNKETGLLEDLVSELGYDSYNLI